MRTHHACNLLLLRRQQHCTQRRQTAHRGNPATDRPQSAQLMAKMFDVRAHQHMSTSIDNDAVMAGGAACGGRAYKWSQSDHRLQHSCRAAPRHPPGKRTSLPSGVLLTLPSTTGDLRASACAYLQQQHPHRSTVSILPKPVSGHCLCCPRCLPASIATTTDSTRPHRQTATEAARW